MLRFIVGRRLLAARFRRTISISHQVKLAWIKMIHRMQPFPYVVVQLVTEARSWRYIEKKKALEAVT
jgi:hypothetical protein